MYELKHLLGKGSYGKVYSAISNITSGKYAIKTCWYIHDNIDECIIRELNILRSLHSNYIIKFKELYFSNDKLFIVMQLGNTTLDKYLLNPSNDRSHELLIHFAKCIVYGVKYIHEYGIIHRDLKPQNIIIVRGTAKIIDFGMCLYSKTLNINDSAICTLWYRAYELLIGESYYTSAIDIWSLGCILAEIFNPNFNPIFAGDSVNMIIKLIINRHDSIGFYDIHHDVKNIVKKCLNRFPIKRPDIYDICHLFGIQTKKPLLNMVINNMKKKELKYYYVTNKYHKVMTTNWFFNCLKDYSISKHTLFQSVNIIERLYPFRTSHIEELYYSAISLASKCEESCGIFCMDDIEYIKMEKFIFSQLNYDVFKPTVIYFLQLYNRCNCFHVILFMNTLAVISLLDHNISPPSLTAAAILYLCFSILKPKFKWKEKYKSITGYDLCQFDKQLTNIQFLYEKYKNNKFTKSMTKFIKYYAYI